VSRPGFPALGFDPAPGQVGDVTAAAMRVARANQMIAVVLPRLQEACRVADDADWGGSAAEEFSDHGDDLPLGLGRGAEAMAEVAEALNTWSTTMAANQREADRLESEARKAEKALEDALDARTEAAGRLPHDSTSKEYQQRYPAFLGAVDAVGTARDRLERIRADARELEKKHLRQADGTADAIRSSPDDAFEVENDGWYVQAFDGIAKGADGVSIVSGTIAAGLAATGVGLLGPAEIAGAVSAVSGTVGGVAGLGQQLSGSRNAPGWGGVALGLLPTGPLGAGVRAGGRAAFRRGSRAARATSRKELRESLQQGGLPGTVKKVRDMREKGARGVASRDLTNSGRAYARRNDIELPTNLAERRAALQELGRLEKQNQGVANLVDNSLKIAQRAGVELSPEQRATAELLKLGIDPVRLQGEKSAVTMLREILKPRG